MRSVSQTIHRDSRVKKLEEKLDKLSKLNKAKIIFCFDYYFFLFGFLGTWINASMQRNTELVLLFTGLLVHHQTHSP